jgi:hypothetical protein
MNVWWWVPIGLAAWCLASVVIARCIGPVLRRSSQVRESLDQQFAETSDGHGKPVPAALRASDSTVVRQR